MSGTHDLGLVLLAVLIGMAASYTALDVVGRMRAAPTRGTYVSWLAAAAFSLGGGIWAMHFVAMLAFSMPGLVVQYDLGLTALSLLLAVAVVGVGFAVVGWPGSGPLALLVSGVFVGLGIAGMHYTGMAAMRMAAAIGYDLWWMALSVLVAVGASVTALWLAFINTGPAQKLLAAVIMGIAISGMHFTGMSAAVYSPDHFHSELGPQFGVDQIALAIAVASITFGILFLALVMAMLDRRLAHFAAHEAETLRQSEEQLRWLYHRTPLPLHAVDSEGRITKVSDAWVELLGYGRDEVVGRLMTDFMTPLSAQQHAAVDWPRLLESGEVRDAEHQFRSSRGQVLDVLLTLRLARSNLDLFAIGGLIDVTARRRAEDALRQAQKMEAVGQLTGGVAHDFNNLLAVVMGNLDLLRKRVPNDPRAQALIENATEGARRGAALTQRMLSFARQQSLDAKPVDVPVLVRGMEDLLRRSLGPQIRVETRFPADPLLANADANQLELALLNLAVNARDAMPEGGVIEVAARRESLAAGAVPGLKAGRYVAITVKDSGAGMNPETLARAREPFFTTKGIGKGTGLGLAMVHGFAEQSGGALVLDSRPGEGTQATLWLPTAEASLAAVSPPLVKQERSDDPQVAADLTILAVDDDPLVLMNTVALLEDLGFRVHAAPNAQRALDFLEADNAVDLVITDEAMPGMRGTQLIETIRAKRPDLPVILATGYADLPNGLPFGLPRLDKPYTQADLQAAIETALSGQRDLIAQVPNSARSAELT